MSIDFGTIALVAYELPSEENLGIRYVAQALIEAGFAVRLLRLNHAGQIATLASEILDASPGLVGCSMSDNRVAALQLALIEYLRSHGYTGSVVAGGAFATMMRHALLDKHSGLDAIVRREGEGPIVRCAEAVRHGTPLEEVAGVTTRAGDGAAFVESCVTPVSRPYRDELPQQLGVPMARVMASRGCHGGCSYCGSASIRKDALKEARRVGYPIEVIRDRGLTKQRRRALDDFADEVAELYHERHVRFFRLIDDHVLGPDAPTALEWLRTLASELTRRNVGRVAFSMMVEPSVVTEEVADAMLDLGVVRVLMGVEAFTASGLRELGRPPKLVEMNRAAVRRLRDRGIAVFYNGIFLHPDSTPASVRSELEALPFVPGVAFDVLPLLVFPGTGLYDRLEREGKLLGGMFACDYGIEDETVSLLRSLLHGFACRMPALRDTSLAAHETAALESLSRRLGRGGLDAIQRRALHVVIDAIGALRQELLLRLLAQAESVIAARTSALPPSSRNVTSALADSTPLVRWLDDLVLTAQPRLLALSEELEGLRRRIEDRSGVAREARQSSTSLADAAALRSSSQRRIVSLDRSRRFVPIAVAAGLVVAAPGCGGAVEDAATPLPASNGGTSAAAGQSQTSNPGSGGAKGGATQQQGGATTAPTGSGGTGNTIILGVGGTTWTSGGSSSTPAYLSTNCVRATKWAIDERLSLLANDGCGFMPFCTEDPILRVDASGRVTDIVPPPSYPYDVASEASWKETRACLLATFSQERYPCLRDGFAWSSHCVLLIL